MDWKGRSTFQKIRNNVVEGLLYWVGAQQREKRQEEVKFPYVLLQRA